MNQVTVGKLMKRQKRLKNGGDWKDSGTVVITNVTYKVTYEKKDDVAISSLDEEYEEPVKEGNIESIYFKEITCILNDKYTTLKVRNYVQMVQRKTWIKIKLLLCTSQI